jgi:hypothetical protein
MGIETYGSMVKQILNDVHDADISVVTLFRKQCIPGERNFSWKLLPELQPDLMDMKQNTPDILRLRTFIFPGEEQKAYVES